MFLSFVCLYLIKSDKGKKLKQTILKYSSLLALLGSTFFSTQTFAAECVNGANAAGCEIDTDDITYTLTGNIAPAAGIDGITLSGFPAFANDNTVTLTGNITTTGDTAHGILLSGVDGNNIHIIGDISVNGVQAYGVYNFFGDFSKIFIFLYLI